MRENGEEVRKIHYTDEADFKVKIEDILKGLHTEKVEYSDITFLTPKQYQKSILGRTGIKVNEINEDMDLKSKLPRFSTIHGFKGLDSKVIIFCGLDDIHDANYSKFAYIAATRARTLLYMVEEIQTGNGRLYDSYTF